MRGRAPRDTIRVPSCFKSSLWAHGINTRGAMTLGRSRPLFVSSPCRRARLRGRRQCGVARGEDTAKGLNLPNVVGVQGLQRLYLAEIHRITKSGRYRWQLDSPPEMKVVYDTLGHE